MPDTIPRYDPVLEVWKRRRARDTFVSVHERTETALQEQIKALLAMLEAMASARAQDVHRIDALESLIVKFASIKEAEAA